METDKRLWSWVISAWHPDTRCPYTPFVELRPTWLLKLSLKSGKRIVINLLLAEQNFNLIPILTSNCWNSKTMTVVVVVEVVVVVVVVV